MNAILRTCLTLACIPALLACDPGPKQEPPAAPSPREAVRFDPPAPEAGAILRTEEILSPIFYVRRKWGSMEGPSHSQPVVLTQPKRPEILWLTGYRASVVGRNGDEGVSQEFMCHNNLDLNARKHGMIFGWSQRAFTRNRVFTISQGQFDLALPKGFGIPVRSDEHLRLTTQVLNHNIENPDLEIRHNVQIDFTRDEDLEEPLKPLYQSGIFIMASLEDTEVYYGVRDADAEHEGSSCSLGDVPEHIDQPPIYTDEFGRKFTGHWVLKPGREVRRTLVTKLLDLSFDTRIHFIAVHLHPFAESLELRDLTSGKSLWAAHARGPTRGIGLTEVDYYSSEEGIPVYKDHEYELVSVYDNLSGVDQDAMATLFLYLYDVEAAKGVESLRRLKRWAAEAK